MITDDIAFLGLSRKYKSFFYDISLVRRWNRHSATSIKTERKGRRRIKITQWSFTSVKIYALTNLKIKNKKMTRSLRYTKDTCTPVTFEIHWFELTEPNASVFLIPSCTWNCGKSRGCHHSWGRRCFVYLHGRWKSFTKSYLDEERGKTEYNSKSTTNSVVTVQKSQFDNHRCSSIGFGTIQMCDY